MQNRQHHYKVGQKVWIKSIKECGHIIGLFPGKKYYIKGYCVPFIEPDLDSNWRIHIIKKRMIE